jgi:predicted amidophosphoribosyltransferase
MIFRTSYGEFGHCLNCFHDFDSEELWEQNIEICPDCGEPLYTKDNPEHYIPEDTDFMNNKLDEHILMFQAEQKYGKKIQNVG